MLLKVNNLKKVDKWVLLCCTMVVEYVFAVDVYYYNVFEFNDKSLFKKNDSERTRCAILQYK